MKVRLTYKDTSLSHFIIEIKLQINEQLYQPLKRLEDLKKSPRGPLQNLYHKANIFQQYAGALQQASTLGNHKPGQSHY